jgi:hypothetical protein
LAAEAAASNGVGKEVETLFIVSPSGLAWGFAGSKTAFIVVDRRRQKRAQFSVCRFSVDR